MITYIQKGSDSKVERLIDGGRSFFGENGKLNNKCVFNKWSAAQFAAIDLYAITNEPKPTPVDPDENYYVIIPLEVGNVFAPQQWEEKTYTPTQKSNNAKSALAELGPEALSRKLEDVVDMLIGLGIITQEQFETECPYVYSDKVKKDNQRSKIIED